MSDIVNNTAHHKAICDELTELYTKKNIAYGDSFSNSFDKFGLVMSAIRLGDKLNRFETLIKNPDIDTFDESVRDTLVDLSNYSIMTIMELDKC